MTTHLSDEEFQAALDKCGSEAIHIPGLIQSHGAMIGVRTDTLAIDYASENLRDIISVSFESALSRDLSEVFESKLRHDLVNGLLRPGAPARTKEVGVAQIGGRDVWISASASDQHTVFEFEPVADGDLQSGSSLQELALLTTRLQAMTTQADLFNAALKLLRVLTGYDRIMLYRFDREFNGEIVAEQKRPGLQSFMGLHFPRRDIPDQARAMMLKIPLRYISDTEYEPARVVAANDTIGPLDLTNSPLRGTSLIHLQYLRNMGNAATFTLHIVVEGKLWGVISMHNMTARRPNPRMRQICEQFATLFALHLGNILKQDRLERIARADALRQEIASQFRGKQIDEVFERAMLRELCASLDADGAAVLFNSGLETVGEVPGDAALAEIMNDHASADGLVFSARLNAELPEIAAIAGPQFGGILMGRMMDDAAFAFFRKCRNHTVNWAGAPDKDVSYDAEGRASLEPRSSFELFKRNVEGEALPWTEDHLRLAGDLWSLFVTAERRVLMERTNQQKVLINELNHRVRNILALIRSLAHKSSDESTSLDQFVDSFDKRIAAVAQAHNLCAEAAEGDITLRRLIEIETEPFATTDTAIRLSGVDCQLRNELVPSLALVIHEMMTNSVKHGALSVDSGVLRIDTQPDKDGVLITWSETGGPEPQFRNAKGFGKRLIENLVPFDLGGHIEMSFLPTGLHATIWLPSKAAVVTQNRTAVVLDASDRPAADTVAVDVRKKVCLLVEDNFLVSLDTSQTLEDVGFENVIVSATVEDALKRIEAEDIGFAVLDVNLGGDVTSIPLAQRLQSAGIPFVFVSGYGRSANVAELDPAPTVLRKPIRTDDLHRVIRGVTA